MTIVQAEVQVESPLPVEVTSTPNGRYLIKNRANNYWSAAHKPQAVYFCPVTMDSETAKMIIHFQVSEHSPIILFFRG